jgi:hypothetical protein
VANRIIADFFGTALTQIKIGLAAAGIRLKTITGGFAVRNHDDSADAELTASQIKISGNNLKLNSDAAGSGADWEYNLARPSSGMTAAVTLTLPVDDGTADQVLKTDGSGNLSWASAGTTADCLKIDETALAFGDSSPVAMFTKEAGARSHLFRCIVTTAFNGTAPTVSIGIAGNTSKYVPATAIDLKTAGIYEFDMGAVAIEVGTEPIIATYSADSSSAGAATLQYCRAVPT